MKDEISFCGLNCSKCVSYNGDYSKKAKEIICAMETSNMDDWQDKISRKEDFDYESFKKGLKWFSEMKSCPGCKDGGGFPECEIKKCCKTKNVNNCGECPELPCEITIRFKEKMNLDIEAKFKNQKK